MAARYATLTIRAGWSWNDSIRGAQTEQVQFKLGGQWVTYRRGGNFDQYPVPDPDDINPQREFVIQAINSLLGLLRTTVSQRGLFYTVSPLRDVGDDAAHGGYDNGNNTPWPLVEFDLTATAYDPTLDLDFSAPTQFGGWTVVQKLTTIQPLQLVVTSTDATIYGSATGTALVKAYGNGAPYTFQWADGPTGAERLGLAAGTYYCNVTDGLGEKARATVIIKSDPRLVVAVNATADSCELVPSGGLGPYAFAWRDGPTTARRTGLAPGTYYCVVSDARGATREVQVVIAPAARYWFSGNPVTLRLTASDPTSTAIVCEVYVEPDYLSGTYVLAGQPLEQPLAAGGTTFEVQELLEPFVAPLLPTSQLGLVRQQGVFARFFLKHYERGPAGAGDATTVEVNYLLHGGLGFVEAAAGTWFGYQERQLPFLTWEPDFKKVLADQPEYLYFMPLHQVGGMSAQLTCTFADGSTRRSALATGGAALAHEVFGLAVGPAALGLPALEAAAGQLVASYQVQVFDDALEPLTEARTFVPDRRPCPVRRYFLYANSLGGWNTLVCRGRGSQELQTKTAASENSRAAGYDPLRGASTISQRTGLPLLKCYTGARSAAQLLADQDFLLSERVLLLAEGRYLAGQVKDAKFTPSDDDETRRVVQFDYELPRERYYTPHLTT